MRPLDPDSPGVGDPGDEGYEPPTDTNARLAVIVSRSPVTFTHDQIVAAGGPWPAFTVRVTPLNGNGSGQAAEVDYPPA